MSPTRFALSLCTTVALVAAGFAADATAQDSGSVGSGSGTYRSSATSGGGWGLDFEVRGGALVPDTSTAFKATAGSKDDTYKDYFGTGYGAGADIALVFLALEETDGLFSLSVRPFIGFDHYQIFGDDQVYDTQDRLEVDDWTVTTFFGGAQLRLTLGGKKSAVRWVAGIDVAGGLVSYGGLSADFVPDGNGTPVVGHLYDASTTSALRGVVRIGTVMRFSESIDFTVHAMAGVLMLGAPEGNTDANNPFGDSDPSAWTPMIAAVGFSLQFRM